MEESDDEEEEDEDEEDEKEDEWEQLQKNTPKETKTDTPIVQFFSKPLSTREKFSLKSSFISHLKEYIFSQRPRNKDLIELKCSILKPLY